MKAFGLELRSVRSVSCKNLYEDVDKVLGKANIVSSGGVSKELQTDAIGHSLHKMMNVKNYFDICTVDKCADIAQVVISKERNDIYKSIHCMNWNDMTDDFRLKIIAMVLDDFRSVLSPEEEENIRTIKIL